MGTTKDSGLKRYFGAHVSSSAGIENAIKNGVALGVNTIQLHPSPPQRWNSKPYPAGFEDAFVAARQGSGIDKVFFHGIYLINLCTPVERNLGLSKSSLVYYLDLNARLNGDGVIFHMGSLKDEPDEKVGFKRAAEAINWILDSSKNEARLILEVAAGSGDVVGDRMEELAEIYSQIENKDRVGFGLDSQHMWASGYDLKENLSGVVADIERVFSLDKVWAFHLNDSKTACCSRKDRHENLGDGLIGEMAIRALLNHPKLIQIPFILETPALKDLETAKVEVQKLRGYIDPPNHAKAA